MSATGYSVDTASEPAFITTSSDNDWPDTMDQINAVTIQYIAGYPLSGASTATTPTGIKAWMNLQIGSLYEHRESLAVDRSNAVMEFPRSFVDGLLDPFVIDEEV